MSIPALKLAYFARPVHPLARDWAQPLEEDRRAVILDLVSRRTA
jgi:hypothetical protein